VVFHALTFGLGFAYWQYTELGVPMWLAVRAVLGSVLGGSISAPWLAIAAAFGVAVLSWGGYHLFSSPQRLRANLPASAWPPEVSPVPTVALPDWMALVTTTGILVVFGVGLAAGEGLLGFRITQVLTFPALVMAVATGFDLVAEWRVRVTNAEPITRLIELDNAHLASWLTGQLRTQGIDVVARSYHFRSLFFFLLPLVMIDLLVPASQLGRARQVLHLAEIAIA
jgi:hypothetical protein